MMSHTPEPWHRTAGCHVSNRRSRDASGPAWNWGPPFATIGEAKAAIRAALAEGRATMGIVVAAQGDDRRPLTDWVFPASAHKVIRHYLELVALCAADPPHS